MTFDLAVLVPSRGRPWTVARLAGAFEATTQDTHRACLYLIVDADEADAYKQATVDAGLVAAPWFSMIVQEPQRLGPTLNQWGPYLATSYPYIGFSGDDHVYRTPGWDRVFCSLLAEARNRVVYGNDLIHGPGLPTAVFMDSTIVKTLGYMVPPGLVHLRFDDAWRDWGNAMGTLAYRDDVVIEHMHPLVGKGERDDTYAAGGENGGVFAEDTDRYQAYRDSGQFAVDVAAMIAGHR